MFLEIPILYSFLLLNFCEKETFRTFAAPWEIFATWKINDAGSLYLGGVVVTVVEHGGTAGCGEPAAVVELSAIQKHPGFDSQFYIFINKKITPGEGTEHFFKIETEMSAWVQAES
jgi:hypothetical protein